MIDHRVMLVLCTAMAVFLVLSCGDVHPPGEPMIEEEVYGTYWANYDIGEEYIELREDSVYVHYYKDKYGKEFVESGAWEFGEEEGGYYRVLLKEFIIRYPLEGLEYSPDRGTIDSTPRHHMPYIEKRNGKLRIKRHPNYGQYYVPKTVDSASNEFRPQ